MIFIFATKTSGNALFYKGFLRIAQK